MKKILLLLITLLTLTACGTNTSSNQVSVNEPLEYSIKIKDNAEFILIHEKTSIDEATQIILDNLDIETNADTYDWYWVGEAAVGLSIDEIENFDEFVSKNTSIYFEDLTLEEIQRATLDYDSLRPVKLIFTFVKNSEETKREKEIKLCVAREEEYNLISNNAVKTVDNLYEILTYQMSDLADYYSYDAVQNIIRDEGYVSNIRSYQYYGAY